MALDVKVKIELSKPTGSAGLGYPLLLECGAESAIAYTECASVDDVVEAGFANTTKMYKAAEAVFLQENRPEKIAVCSVTGTAIDTLPAIVSKEWRQLVLVGGDKTAYVTVADYIETTANKMFFISMSADEFDSFKTSIQDKTYDRTVIFVNGTENACAALVGETAGRSAGSFTYKFKTLNGVKAEELTDQQITNLHKAGAFGYVTKAGDDVTTEGIAQSGKYIDITDSVDYVVQNIEYKVQKVFNTNAKVNFDDSGISLIESAVKIALQEAYANGIIATNESGEPDFTVSFASRSSTTEQDRESREYKYGTFSFALAGAIHYCTVTGTITY